VRELANRFLFEFHDSIAALPGATKSRQMVVARAVEYLNRLAAETGDDRRLEGDLAAGYERIRDIQYGYDFGHLNDVEGAVAGNGKFFAGTSYGQICHRSFLGNTGLLPSSISLLKP